MVLNKNEAGIYAFMVLRKFYCSIYKGIRLILNIDAFNTIPKNTLELSLSFT